ncbi:MAG: altronate dehydratase family protein [Eubacteriales bacterium]|nr:altronate dehydratase family protein [Eubacteriales bacterium]
MDKVFIKINTADKVCVALQPIKAGSVLDLVSFMYADSSSTEKITVTEDIPQGHKFALTDIDSGEAVVKYGNVIGYAKEDIKKGQWIHVHNMKTGLGELLEYKYNPGHIENVHTEDRTFKGYRRADGKVGVRNEIWIIPTVGCVNNVAAKIAELSKRYIKGNVEDVIAFSHPYGCSQMGDDQENTRTILADLINHPNAAGVLVLGLGCENSNIDVLKAYLGEIDENRVKFLVSQEHEDEIADSVELVKELIDYAKDFEREDIPASELVIGMKCGGSDGLSGITANPTVGMFSDLLISKGGTTILTEVPEMFGAETLLMNRCENEELFDKTVKMINDFKNYFTEHGQTIYENPSPGNKKGGISTLEDKSLGCVQKSGSAAVRGVLKYGETVKEKGLNLLSAPGNDLVASTACAAAGAHIVLFTTGRGTPFASPVPTVKISTNNLLNSKKHNWIDFSCGELVNGKKMDELRDELFEFVIKVASGEKVKSEAAGFHDMAIFKSGVTL